MPELRRMLPSSNALFVFDAAARNGSFTAAAAELNVTQPAVSRMLGRFEDYLGVRLFDRTAGGAILTEEGELLHRRVLDGFRSIESGLIEIERRRRGTETVTLSVSSAFTTHWLMPRIDKLQRQFPSVDLRFQLISGSLRGPVENVDFGMRFRDQDDPDSNGALVMKEVMLPICSPGYRDVDTATEANDGSTIIKLADTPEEACRIAAEVTNQYLRDLPFTLLYLLDMDGHHARLAATSGLGTPSEDIAPSVVPIVGEGEASPWNML